MHVCHFEMQECISWMMDKDFLATNTQNTDVVFETKYRNSWNSIILANLIRNQNILTY